MKMLASRPIGVAKIHNLQDLVFEPSGVIFANLGHHLGENKSDFATNGHTPSHARTYLARSPLRPKYVAASPFHLLFNT